MSLQAAFARRARTATEIDATNDAAARECTVQSSADELVPGNAAKGHVSACELEIGVADAGGNRTHAYVPIALGWPWMITNKPRRGLRNDECQHIFLRHMRF